MTITLFCYKSRVGCHFRLICIMAEMGMYLFWKKIEPF
jgi:hypothetical protein